MIYQEYWYCCVIKAKVNTLKSQEKVIKVKIQAVTVLITQNTHMKLNESEEVSVCLEPLLSHDRRGRAYQCKARGTTMSYFHFLCVWLFVSVT